MAVTFMKADKISKSFGSHAVLQDFSAEFTDPGITCIMGRSGSGKTTLLNIMMGRLKADQGSITGFSGRTLGAVFQEDRLLPWCTALENVALVLNGDDVKERALRILARVHLEESAMQKVTELSGGMKRRVAIARALAFDPEILILDEPFKGLDDELRLEVMELVREFSSERAVIIVTHDHVEAEFFAAKMVYL